MAGEVVTTSKYLKIFLTETRGNLNRFNALDKLYSTPSFDKFGYKFSYPRVTEPCSRS